MSRTTAQGGDQRDTAAERPQSPPRVDHDRSPAPHSRHDVAVMAHIRGASTVPALIVGIDDPDRPPIHRTADQRRLAGAREAGDDDDGVVGIGEAHAMSLGGFAEAAVKPH